jgi:hypothetical protein
MKALADRHADPMPARSDAGVRTQALGTLLELSPAGRRVAAEQGGFSHDEDNYQINREAGLDRHFRPTWCRLHDLSLQI